MDQHCTRGDSCAFLHIDDDILKRYFDEKDREEILQDYGLKKIRDLSVNPMSERTKRYIAHQIQKKKLEEEKKTSTPIGHGKQHRNTRSSGKSKSSLGINPAL